MTQTMQHPDPEMLSAFIDGELPAGEQQAIRQHLTGCHACALRVLSATQFKAATARAGHRFVPPPDTLVRLTAQLRKDPPANARIGLTRRASWLALAAALVLAALLIGMRAQRERNTLAAELLDEHLSTLSSGATPQVISTDRHTVKPWFQGRLPFSFNLPDAPALPPDTLLKGANLTYLNGQPAALLLFTIHKHEVSVFLTQRAGPNLASLPSARSGFSIQSAMTHDLHIVAVSDVNPSDLSALVTSLAQAQSSF
jgi:anti-sigma factor RsiW